MPLSAPFYQQMSRDCPVLELLYCRQKTLGGRRMELVGEVKELLIETAKELKGSARRLFLARTVHALGEGGQRLAERELGWNRGTIRKGQHERVHGIVCIDAYSWRGRK